ncbi:glycosyltransferase family 61 protein [Jiangella endophytica]|uniref:glycosyltransferase family 61 protein n=1 Tax=Jiangella endophytica TaxID=1623398 RepID=UPI000E3548F2|nr:glycosyltransferase 61 family protein [Jiangella endophytica]
MQWDYAVPPDSPPPPAAVRTVRGALLSGWSSVHIGTGPTRRSRGAVYDGGRLVPESLRAGGYDGDHVVADDPAYCADPAVDRLAGRWLYGGHWMSRFGHFVTETLTSLWPVGREVDGLVFHRFVLPGTPLDYQTELVRRSGWDVPLRVVTRPTEVEELVVPDRPYHPGRRTSAEAVDVWDRAAVAARPGPPVFLSRTRLPNDRRRSDGDELVDALMERLGFRVLHPQELPIAAQLSAVASAPVIAGVSGPALHLSAFAPQATRVLEIGDIRTRTRPPGDQRVIDAARGRLTAFVPHLGRSNVRDVGATMAAVTTLLARQHP